MRLLPIALSILLTTAAFSTASAQAPRPPQAPPPAGKQQPGKQQAQPAMPPPAPAAPYNPVAITLPKPLADPAFEAFRKQLGEIAKRKDRPGLAKLVVAQGFFWEGEKGDKAAKNKPGIDNLSSAIKLGGKGFGWEILAGYAADPTAMPFPNRKDVFCAPADPTFSDQDFQALFKGSKTEPYEWGFMVADGVEVRSGPQPNAPVVEKLGLHFVRVMSDAEPPPTGQKPDPNQVPPIKIVAPSGKTGFIPVDALASLGNDQLCYLKDAAGWKITGFVGGDMP